MGGSRRRLKRDAPKVKVAVVKRSKKQKAPTPLEISAERPGVPEKLGRELTWEQSNTTRENYAQLGLRGNANRLGSASSAQAQPTTSGRADTAGIKGGTDQKAEELDVDLRAALGYQVRSQPDVHPLTAHQRRIVERLITKHGSDVAGMVRDRKLNQMLLPAGKLRAMVRAYEAHPPGTPVRFQVPKKGLS